jgi:hypothetical protein
MTPKQKLQKDRAYFKYVLSGIPKPIKEESLTQEEQILWQSLLLKRNSLLTNFENNSRELGLRVPEHRCWCGKAAKIEVLGVDYYENGSKDWVCNKHKNI